MKVKGVELPENCTLEFCDDGIKVTVTLNVSYKLLKYMPENTYEGRRFCVYFTSKKVPLPKATPRNIIDTFKYLQSEMMALIRVRKSFMLTDEARHISDNSIKLKY